MAKNKKLEHKGGKNPKTTKKAKKTAKTKQESEVVLTEIFTVFICWMILTPKERLAEKAPKDQKSFAKKYRVSPDTLTDWKKREDFKTRSNSAFKEKLAADVPQVLESLKDRALKYGKADDVELYLAFSIDWDKRRVLEIKNPVQFGEGDIRLLISRLPKDKQQAFYQTLTALMAEAQDVELNG